MLEPIEGADRPRDLYLTLRAEVARLWPRLLLVVTCLCGIGLALIDITVAVPLFHRVDVLHEYWKDFDKNSPQLSEGGLSKEVLLSISKIVPPSFSKGRLLYQRVEGWAPIPLNDVSTRSEAIRKVADDAPVASYSYLPSGKTVLGGYRSLLNELRQDAEIRSTNTVHAPTVERIERSVFSIGQGAYSLAEIDRARRRIENFDIYNPQTKSIHPPVTLENCDLDRWLASPLRQEGRMELNSLESPSKENTVMNAGSQRDGEAESAFKGGVRTSVFASDWRVCVISRPWFEESIIERIRNGIDPFVNTRDLFATGGALAVLPYALVVARDVSVQIIFSNQSDFEYVKATVANGQAAEVHTSASRLIVDGTFAAFDATKNAILIPTPSGSAQVVFVISKLY